MEILVRIAKEKYIVKPEEPICATITEAVVKLLEEHLITNLKSKDRSK